MPYTARQLIINAYHTSNIISTDYEAISGSYLQDGLFRLNSILDVLAINEDHIPYYRTYDFNTVIDQEEYFVPNMIAATTFTFRLDTNNQVRFATRRVSRDDYWGTDRVENIGPYPGIWQFERVKGGSNIYMFPVPKKVYPAQLLGKFSLQNVEINEDLTQTYDNFYIEYLMYLLAEKLCDYFSVVVPPSVNKNIAKLEQYTTDISPMDTSIDKLSYFRRYNNFDEEYGNINRRFGP